MDSQLDKTSMICFGRLGVKSMCACCHIKVKPNSNNPACCTKVDFCDGIAAMQCGK